jgi:hypothetical protein
LDRIEKTSPWLLGDVDLLAWPRFLVARPDGPSLMKQMELALSGQVVRRLVVIAPFFDRALGGLKALRTALHPEKVSLVVQTRKVSLPGNALSPRLANTYCFSPKRTQRSRDAYLHAKLYLIQTDQEEYCLWGSPNCTVAALTPRAGQGNFEAGLLAKGPKGYFQNRLGLGPSLAKLARIDDSSLFHLRADLDSTETERIRLAGVEYVNGQLEVTIANGANVPDEQSGRIVLTSIGEVIAEVPASRVAERIFHGRWNPGKLTATVVARLVLGTGRHEIKSTAAAVHFHAILEYAVPSRRAMVVRKLLDGIQEGTEPWADGLEKVCEAIFRLEMPEDDKALKTSLPSVTKHVISAENDDGKKVGYPQFVTGPSPKGESGHSAASQSNFLLEVVQMLNKRLFRNSDTGDDANEPPPTRDWYREEEEQDTAGSGDVAAPDEAMQPEVRARLYQRLHRHYFQLTKNLTLYVQGIIAQKQVAVRDELMRLHIIIGLLLHATNHEVDGAEQCGPLMRPRDLEHEMLPVIAMLLGRSAKTPPSFDQSLDRPILLRTDGKLEDSESIDAGCVISVFLSALVVHRKQSADKTRFLVQDHETQADYVELLAARSFMVLRMLGALPASEAVEQSIESMRSGFPWLLLLGESVLTTFQDLSERSQRISEMESGVAPESSQSLGTLDKGAWVLTKHWGVTEVVRIGGNTVTVAVIDGPDTALIKAKPGRQNVRLTGLRRSF